MGKLASTLSFGADYKHYQAESANADNFYELIMHDQQRQFGGQV